MILIWRVFAGLSALKVEELFEFSHSDRTRGHNLKLQVQSSRLDIRKKFFSHRVVTEWSALSSEAVNAETLSRFKGFLHRGLKEKLFSIV